jgi:hypothetical protein
MCASRMTLREKQGSVRRARGGYAIVRREAGRGNVPFVCDEKPGRGKHMWPLCVMQLLGKKCGVLGEQRRGKRCALHT